MLPYLGELFIFSGVLRPLANFCGEGVLGGRGWTASPLALGGVTMQLVRLAMICTAVLVGVSGSFSGVSVAREVGVDALLGPLQ